MTDAPDGPWPPGPRSLLFVPADRAARLLPKALRSGADAVILDLEDGVAPEAKADGRREAMRALRDRQPDESILLRVNGAGTAEHAADLEIVRDARPAAVLVPKCDDPTHLAMLGRSSPGTSLVPLIESAAGVAAAAEICRAPAVVGVAFGAIDFAASLAHPAARAPALVDHARVEVSLAAAAAGIWAVDGPCLELNRADLLEAESLVARRAGCSGKLIVHPAQVATVHAVFRPSATEVARARRIIDAYDRMVERGEGAARLDGLMVDAAVAAAARRAIEADERAG